MFIVTLLLTSTVTLSKSLPLALFLIVRGIIYGSQTWLTIRVI
jgi:hypothetical protein